jgi:hypothetical protein
MIEIIKRIVEGIYKIPEIQKWFKKIGIREPIPKIKNC